MPTHPLTIDVPDTIYERLRELAASTDRSIEDETLEVLATAMPDDELPTDIRTALASLDELDDDALLVAARSRLPPDVGSQLELLHLKRNREGLSTNETTTLQSLVNQFERHMLTRAQAASLLKGRG